MRETDSKRAQSSLVERLKGLVCGCAAVMGPISTGLSILLVLVSIFYLEENWRGKHAYAKARAQVAADGKEVDYAKLIPPPVPDDQNFFKAPHMQEWFTGRGSRDLSRRLEFLNFQKFAQQSGGLVARVTLVRPDAQVAPGDADLVLSWHDPKLTISKGPEEVATNGPSPSREVIPLLKMDEPLSDALRNLALRAQIVCRIDPKVKLEQFDQNGRPRHVTGRWNDKTAYFVLTQVLSNNNLRLVFNYQNGTALITSRDNSKVQVETGLTAQLGNLLIGALPPTNSDNAPRLEAAMGFSLSAQPLGKTKPARIVVRADAVPDSAQVCAFFPQRPLNTAFTTFPPETQARSTGINTFDIYLSPAPSVSAADYLAWSDQFESDFDAFRAALKRPYARMDGDYTQPNKVPVPNFVTIRVVAQTLAQRAQCHLLLGESDKALRDLMLIREMCRLMEGRPTGKPMTLIAVMINNAVTGLYTSVLRDGMRLHAWNETQLTALEEQLKEVNLPPMFSDAVDWERLASCAALEKVTAGNYKQIVEGKQEAPTLEQKLKDPTYFLLLFQPRGWMYQNMAAINRIHHAGLGKVVLTNGLMSPINMSHAIVEVDKAFAQKSPLILFAAMVVPNYIHAAQTLAYNQTQANEARVACALERYHATHAQYPETLDALMPQFIDRLPRDIISGDALKYRREGDHFTLTATGWNQNGTVSTSSNKAADAKDWVWADQAQSSK